MELGLIPYLFLTPGSPIFDTGWCLLLLSINGYLQLQLHEVPTRAAMVG